MKWAKFCVTPNVGGIVILVLADHYPSRPRRLVVPFGPDGGADSIARNLAKRVSRTIDQMIVIENRAGAASIIGTEVVQKSDPDGYTLPCSSVAFCSSVL